MSQQEAVREAIKIVGGLKVLAAERGITIQAVHRWIANGVPAEYCPEIERMTKGKVTCEQLRPDVNWAVLREHRPS